MSDLKPRRDVIVSSGHKNFHMLFTAAEMERRGRLSRLICGAYPTIFEQKLLSSWPLSSSAKLSRFANRVEKVSEHRIRQSRFSEVLSAMSRHLERVGVNRELGAVEAFRIYGKSAEGVLRQAAKEGAEYYHYRAGFGQSSVQVAKSLGMKTICDHSIVHPALLKQLIDLKGIFPEQRPASPEGVWGAVLDDIHAADHVVVNSDFVADTFRFMGFDSTKLSVVYQGVEDKFFNALPESREYYEAGSNRPIRFLFAGGIIPRKGIDEIASAMKELSSQKIELHFAGSLPEESRKRYSSLLSDERLTYHGMLSQRGIAKLMSESDVFLFPSRAEGSARVIFEAMAAGCAVICTPNSGSAVKDMCGGRLIPTNSQSKLIEVIQDVLVNPCRYSEFGKANAQLIKKSFTQSCYGNNLESVYGQE